MIGDFEFVRRYYIAAEKLRRFEGDTLEMVADDGEHDSMVICVGGWTEFEREQFMGDNILIAMETAALVWAERYRDAGVPEARLADVDIIDPYGVADRAPLRRRITERFSKSLEWLANH